MRASRFAAEQSCRDLMARYCDCVDSSRYDELAALFASDGVLHIAGRSLRGTAEIITFFEDRPASLSVHLAGAGWVEADIGRRTAQGGCSAAVYRIVGDPAELTLPQVMNQFPVVARYEDSFVDTATGWRFAERRATAVFVPA